MHYDHALRWLVDGHLPLVGFILKIVGNSINLGPVIRQERCLTTLTRKKSMPYIFCSTNVAAIFLLAASISAVEPAKYRLTFDDEFTSEFNQDRWQTTDFHGIRNNGGDFQAQWFSDPRSAPSGFTAYNPFIPSGNGSLSIQADRTPAGVYSQKLPFVSGMISTAHKYTQRYGYFELRAKLPTGPGLWSRFWLLTDNGAWPGEYDVFEVLGRDNSPDPKNYFTYAIRQTTHYWDALSAHGIDGSAYRGINPFDGNFHTYGFLWKPDSVTWFVDGVATLKQANRINIPMYVILDLAVGTDPNWPGKVDATTPFPAKMEMDYFRIYSNDPSLPSVTPDPGYTLSSLLPAEVVVDQEVATPPRPTGWMTGDIGQPDVPGSSTWNPTSGEWILKGAGNTISTSGQCQFAHTELPGDGAVTASVINVTEVAANDVRAGVTMRANANPGSAEVSLYYKASIPWPSLEYTTTLTLQSRDTNGGTMVEERVDVPTVPSASTISPVTLCLIRSDKSITAKYSTDGGISWTQVGAPRTVAMSGTLLAGIAMGGNQNCYRKPARAIFDNVLVGQILPALTSPSNRVVTGETLAFTPSLQDPLTSKQLPQDSITWSVVSGGGTISTGGVYTAPKFVGTGLATVKAVMNGIPVTRTIAVTLPSPWTMPALTRTPPGDVGCVSGTWTVVGGGAGISTKGGQDFFRFVPTLVKGNETLTARFDSAAGHQAGLMLRDFTSFEDNAGGRGSRYAGLWRTPTGLQWATREVAGKSATLSEEIPLPPGPIWLRLTRSGDESDVFTAFFSNNGTEWTRIGSPKTFALTDPAFAGLAVASGSDTTIETTQFSQVAIASRRAGSPTMVLPASCPAKVGGSPTRIKDKKGIVGVLGADDGGEAALTYSWSATGPGKVQFADNGTNTAKSTTATFSKSGTYVVTVTITDAEKLTVVSSVSTRVQ